MKKLFIPPRKPVLTRPFDLPEMDPESVSMCADIYQQVVAAGRDMKFMRIGFHASPNAPVEGDCLCVATCDRGILVFSDQGAVGGRFLFALQTLMSRPQGAEPGDHWRFKNGGLCWYRGENGSRRHSDLLSFYTEFYGPTVKPKAKTNRNKVDDAGAPPAFSKLFPGL